MVSVYRRLDTEKRFTLKQQFESMDRKVTL